MTARRLAVAAVLAALIAVPLAAPGVALAQQSAAPAATGSSADSGFDFGGSQPIEISADNGIEWNRDAKTYSAHGNAVASQGNSEIHADLLIAYYTGSSNQIDRVLAEGAVKIMNPTQTAYGDRADYDRTRKLLVMTGGALKIVTQTETVTARDALEYWQSQDTMVARGDVYVVKTDGTKINGDLVTNYFRKNATTGKREAFQVKADGHVRIDTGKEVATCNHAVFDPNTKIAVLTGNVVMTQNRNVFRGERAEIDTDKGISRLMPAPGERVRSVIQPKNSNSPAGTPNSSPSGTSGGTAPTSSSTGGAMPSQSAALAATVASQ